MTNLEALEKLYISLGGESDLEDVTTSSDVIPLLKNVIGGGGGSTKNIIVPVNFTINENDHTVTFVVGNAKAIMDMIDDITTDYSNLNNYNVYSDYKHEPYDGHKLFLMPEMCNGYFAFHSPVRNADLSPWAEGLDISCEFYPGGEFSFLYNYNDNFVVQTATFDRSNITENDTFEFTLEIDA